MSIHPRVRGHGAPAQLASPAGTPLSVLGWKAAFWADDPLWTNPGNGGAVSTWRDGGTAGSYTVTQASGTKQPTFRTGVTNLNGQSAVEFDGTSDNLQVATPTVAQPYTIIGVLDVVSATGTPIFSDAVGAGRAALFINAGASWAIYTGGAAALSSASAPTTGRHVLRGLFDYMGSAIVNEATTKSGALSNSTGFTGISLGAGTSGSANYASMRLGFWGLYLGDITRDPNWQNLRRILFNLYGATVS